MPIATRIKNRINIENDIEQSVPPHMDANDANDDSVEIADEFRDI